MRRTTTTRFDFPPGVFEMAEQLLVPEGVHIAGAADPNDWSNPASAPDYATQTLFLATRGATSYDAPYCFADDMVTTRVGYVLSSFVTVERVSYQGLDTIRPADNGALCGGGAFETKGCALNDCSNTVNNGGSDGMASVNVTIRDVRVNDFYYDDDAPLIEASVDGNYNCSEYGGTNCCFCLPNGVRSTQVAVWVPLARSNGSSATATRNLIVENLVSRSTQADGVNLHGLVRDAVVANVRIEAPGTTRSPCGAATSPPRAFVSRAAVSQSIPRCSAQIGTAIAWRRVSAYSLLLRHLILCFSCTTSFAHYSPLYLFTFLPTILFGPDTSNCEKMASATSLLKE